MAELNTTTAFYHPTPLKGGIPEAVLFSLLEEAQNPTGQGNKAKKASSGAKTEGNTSPTNPQTLGIFGMVFFLLLDSMNARQDSVTVGAKLLTNNADLQKELNKANEIVQFSVVPQGAQEATIAAVQDRNQLYAAERENIQSELVTVRQDAQTETTNTSVNVDQLEQYSSETSGWLKTLNTIFQVVSGMIKSS